MSKGQTQPELKPGSPSGPTLHTQQDSNPRKVECQLVAAGWRCGDLPPPPRGDGRHGVRDVQDASDSPSVPCPGLKPCLLASRRSKTAAWPCRAPDEFGSAFGLVDDYLHRFRVGGEGGRTGVPWYNGMLGIQKEPDLRRFKRSAKPSGSSNVSRNRPSRFATIGYMVPEYFKLPLTWTLVTSDS